MEVDKNTNYASFQNERLKSYYEALFHKYGRDKRSLGWDKGKQYERFHQLTAGLSLNNASILDVGCGFGNFVDYLELIKADYASYLGVDLVAASIEIAAEKQTNKQTNKQITFVCGDFCSLNNETMRSDFVIASGIFNIRHNDVNPYHNLEAVLEKMFACCNIAVSVDMLSDKVDYRYETCNYYAPEKVLAIAYGLSRRVILRNDYFPFEYSVTIYKDDSFKKETTMFHGAKLEFEDFVQFQNQTEKGE